MNQLGQLIALLNAALEHAPPQTKQILTTLAQPLVRDLEAQLAPPAVATGDPPTAAHQKHG